MPGQSDISRWNPASLKDGQVVVVAAPRDSGKSVLVADLLWHKRHIPCGIAMSATESSNHYYGKYLPPGFVYDEFSPEALQNVVNHQKEMLRRLTKRGLSEKDLPPVFVIIDDCVFDPRFRKDPTLSYLFTNGRHINVMLVVVTQFINYLTPAMRGNVDTLFLLRDNNTNAIKNYYQGFGGIFPKQADFTKVFHVLTQDYCAMVITKSRSTRVEDSVFWYRAALRSPFNTGDQKFWEVNRKLYDSRHEDRARDEQVVRRVGFKAPPG